MTDESHRIELAHGGGGRRTSQWIQERILTRFGSGPLQGLPDAARVACGPSDVVFTTDSYVVTPLEFPGGNIGSLAVNGTVNDLAVSGARPRWLSLALILEEGVPLDTVDRVLDTVRTCADACGVQVATGDTKVVERGRGDGLYINTAGIGEPLDGYRIDPSRIQTGDVLIVSGSVGDHGMTVMAARERLACAESLESDCAPVHRLVEVLTPRLSRDVRFMRDPTRGGLATVVNEIVHHRRIGVRLDEQAIPVHPAAAATAELLGVDILHVACEGRVLAVVSEPTADDILSAWRKLPEGLEAAIIGRVTDDAGRVSCETVTGGHRLLDVPLGEILPRIC